MAGQPGRGRTRRPQRRHGSSGSSMSWRRRSQHSSAPGRHQRSAGRFRDPRWPRRPRGLKSRHGTRVDTGLGSRYEGLRRRSPQQERARPQRATRFPSAPSGDAHRRSREAPTRPASDRRVPWDRSSRATRRRQSAPRGLRAGGPGRASRRQCRPNTRNSPSGRARCPSTRRPSACCRSSWGSRPGTRQRGRGMARHGGSRSRNPLEWSTRGGGRRGWT